MHYTTHGFSPASGNRHRLFPEPKNASTYRSSSFTMEPCDLVEQENVAEIKRENEICTNIIVDNCCNTTVFLCFSRKNCWTCIFSSPTTFVKVCQKITLELTCRQRVASAKDKRARKRDREGRDDDRDMGLRGGKMSRSQAAGRTGYIRTSLLRQNQ